MIQQRCFSNVFFAGGCCNLFLHGQGCPLFDKSVQHFLCQPRHQPPSQVVLKDGFVDTVMMLDMPEPCKYLSLDSCQKRLLWPTTRQLILFHIKSLVLCSKEEMQRSFLRHLVSKAWSLFSDCKSQLQTSRTLHGVTNSGNVLKV